MAHSATVSSKGQITLPKSLRDKHHLSEGELALVLDLPEGILIRHGRRSLNGILGGQLDVAGMEKDIRSVRKEWRL
ncbi:MAG: AbrB/MazE/SpoVT family DNA-binding domain-containing protein [Thermoplasmata archaeon]